MTLEAGATAYPAAVGRASQMKPSGSGAWPFAHASVTVTRKLSLQAVRGRGGGGARSSIDRRVRAAPEARHRTALDRSASEIRPKAVEVDGLCAPHQPPDGLTPLRPL